MRPQGGLRLVESINDYSVVSMDRYMPLERTNGHSEQIGGKEKERYPGQTFRRKTLVNDKDE